MDLFKFRESTLEYNEYCPVNIFQYLNNHRINEMSVFAEIEPVKTNEPIGGGYELGHQGNLKKCIISEILPLENCVL